MKPVEHLIGFNFVERNSQRTWEIKIDQIKTSQDIGKSEFC